MSVTTPARQVAAPPCLTSGSWGGRLIGVLFAATVVLFAVALVALG